MVITGIQPEVAVTLARRGLKLDGVATVLDLKEGLEQFRNWCRSKARSQVASLSRKSHLLLTSKSLYVFRNCSSILGPESTRLQR